MSGTAERIPTGDEWQQLDTTAVRQWVRQRGGSTVVVVEGTRRWYQFTHLRGAAPPEDRAAYLAAGSDAHIRLLEELLAHGLEPLFVPLIVPLQRGARYAQQMLGHGLPYLFAHPRMNALLRQARVRFYGAWPELPDSWIEARHELDRLRESFDALEAASSANQGPRFFFRIQTGAGDPAQELLDLALSLTERLGRPPDSDEVLAEFYHLDPGEEPAPVNLFLSSELEVSKFMPPLLGGGEEPYFTADSLLALDCTLLRRILYDYVFLRHGPPGAADRDLERYDSLSAQQRHELAAWQTARSRKALGLGARHPSGDFWYPQLDGAETGAHGGF